MKAGKLAKPSVAMAMPPTLTETKKVTQWAASKAPEITSTNSCAGVSAPSSGGGACGEQAQRGDGEDGAAHGDDHGAGLDQFAEDAGQAEQHGGDVDVGQGALSGHAAREGRCGKYKCRQGARTGAR